MIDVDANDHQATHWHFDSPESAAKFAVDLKKDLLDHAAQLIFLSDRLRDNDLTYKNATQNFNTDLLYQVKRIEICL